MENGKKIRVVFLCGRKMVCACKWLLSIRNNEQILYYSSTWGGGLLSIVASWTPGKTYPPSYLGVNLWVCACVCVCWSAHCFAYRVVSEVQRCDSMFVCTVWHTSPRCQTRNTLRYAGVCVSVCACLCVCVHVLMCCVFEKQGGEKVSTPHSTSGPLGQDPSRNRA